MGRSVGPLQPIIGVREQAVFVRGLSSWSADVRGGVLTARGLVTPGPLFGTYPVILEYRPPGPPKVRVEVPLRKRDDQPSVPHTYAPDEPCVFDPEAREWTPDKRLTVVVDWLQLWFAYYEDWLVTGDWAGGGRHPVRKSR